MRNRRGAHRSAFSRTCTPISHVRSRPGPGTRRLALNIRLRETGSSAMRRSRRSSPRDWRIGAGLELDDPHQAALEPAKLFDQRLVHASDGLLDPSDLFSDPGAGFTGAGGLGPAAHDPSRPLHLPMLADDGDDLDGSALLPERAPERTMRAAPGTAFTRELNCCSSVIIPVTVKGCFPGRQPVGNLLSVRRVRSCPMLSGSRRRPPPAARRTPPGRAVRKTTRNWDPVRRRRELGLGSAALVSLAEAREKALANRKLAREGGDPLAEKRRMQGVPSFAEAAARVVEQKRAGWRSRAHDREWILTFERYAFPRTRRVPVSEVTSADALEWSYPGGLKR